MTPPWCSSVVDGAGRHRDIISQSTFKVPTGHTDEHPAAIAGAPPPGISRCGSSRWARIGTPGLVASGHPWGSGIDTPSHDASQRSRPRVVAISRTRACRDCSVASAAGELASAKGSAMGPRLRIGPFFRGDFEGPESPTVSTRARKMLRGEIRTAGHSNRTPWRTLMSAIHMRWPK
jgi:hypothetical protein